MRGLGDGLSHLFRMTRALVAGGRRVDIAGVERQVGLFCAKTLDLPPEDGRTLRPMLVSLLADLDALSGDLDALSSDLEALSGDLVQPANIQKPGQIPDS